MRAKVSRRLVIDACVLRAAGGEEATFPLSKHCRDALKTTLEVCHKAAVTPPLQEEWKKHRSVFARSWQTAMIARKKLVLLDAPSDLDLRGVIEGAAVTEREREAMLKDVHLAEAAQAADGIVVSCDETVRSLFAAVSKSAPALKGLVWVNPGEDAERAQGWLKDGAPSDKAYQLGTRRVVEQEAAEKAPKGTPRRGKR